jgi:signal transduction histidine kinase
LLLTPFNVEEARPRTRVLVADLDPAFRESAREYLASLSYRVALAADRGELDRALAEAGDPVHVVVADIRLAGSDPRGFVTRLLAARAGTDLVIATGYLTMDVAIGALRAGAFDIVQKPPIWDRVGRTLDILIERRALRERPERAGAAAPATSSAGPPATRADVPGADGILGVYDLMVGMQPAFGFVQMLSAGKLGELSQEQRDALAVIQDRLAWLNRRVSAQLAAAARDPLALPVQPEVVEITELVEWAVEMLRPMAYQAGVEITSHMPAPTTVFVDRDRLVLILLAVTVNAIQATRPGGQVAVALDSTSDRLVLRVSDSGIGIPAEHRSRVFERFFKVPGDDRPATDGLGIGLAAASLNATLLEAMLDFECIPGQGTTFRLSLPRAPSLGG